MVNEAGDAFEGENTTECRKDLFLVVDGDHCRVTETEFQFMFEVTLIARLAPQEVDGLFPPALRHSHEHREHFNPLHGCGVVDVGQDC